MQAQRQIKRALSEPRSLARIHALMDEAPGFHRTAVADLVCDAFDFVGARGRAQRAGCWKTQLGQAVREVAILGGYLNRHHDPPSGHQCGMVMPPWPPCVWPINSKKALIHD